VTAGGRDRLVRGVEEKKKFWNLRNGSNCFSNLEGVSKLKMENAVRNGTERSPFLNFRYDYIYIYLLLLCSLRVNCNLKCHGVTDFKLRYFRSGS